MTIMRPLTAGAAPSAHAWLGPCRCSTSPPHVDIHPYPPAPVPARGCHTLTGAALAGQDHLVHVPPLKCHLIAHVQAVTGRVLYDVVDHAAQSVTLRLRQAHPEA